MRLLLRRIGNSLGIIIPKSTLDAWNVAEGSWLELTAKAVRPFSSSAPVHDVLDELKRKLAVAVAARYSANHIRAHGLANLHRWRENGVWVSAYDEWRRILEDASDGELFAVLLGRDDHCNRLRQSPPYVGLLPREEVTRLNEEASA